MKKTFKSSLAFILALTMIFSCAFASSASAETAQPSDDGITLAELPKKLMDAAKYAYYLYETYMGKYA